MQRAQEFKPASSQGNLRSPRDAPPRTGTFRATHGSAQAGGCTTRQQNGSGLRLASEQEPEPTLQRTLAAAAAAVLAAVAAQRSPTRGTLTPGSPAARPGHQQPPQCTATALDQTSFRATSSPSGIHVAGLESADLATAGPERGAASPPSQAPFRSPIRCLLQSPVRSPLQRSFQSPRTVPQRPLSPSQVPAQPQQGTGLIAARATELTSAVVMAAAEATAAAAAVAMAAAVAPAGARAGLIGDNVDREASACNLLQLQLESPNPRPTSAVAGGHPLLLQPHHVQSPVAAAVQPLSSPRLAATAAAPTTATTASAMATAVAVATAAVATLFSGKAAEACGSGPSAEEAAATVARITWASNAEYPLQPGDAVEGGKESDEEERGGAGTAEEVNEEGEVLDEEEMQEGAARPGGRGVQFSGQQEQDEEPYEEEEEQAVQEEWCPSKPSGSQQDHPRQAQQQLQLQPPWQLLLGQHQSPQQFARPQRQAEAGHFERGELDPDGTLGLDPDPDPLAKSLAPPIVPMTRSRPVSKAQPSITSLHSEFPITLRELRNPFRTLLQKGLRCSHSDVDQPALTDHLRNLRGLDMSLAPRAPGSDPSGGSLVVEQLFGEIC